MLVKLAHYLLLVVNTFTKALPSHTPWEIFLEGQERLTFYLNIGPNYLQTMGLYARTQFLPFHYMQTFEEIIVTGFIDNGLSVFGPNVKNISARYVAYKEAKYGDLAFQRMKFLAEAQKREDIWLASLPK